MRNKRFFYKIPLIHMSITLLIFLIFGLLFYLLYCDRKSKTFVTYEQDETTEFEGRKCVYLKFSTPNGKSWQQNGFYGAQHDGKFYNTTNHTFTDWTVEAEVPPGYWVDSSWNSDASYFFTTTKPIKDNRYDTPDYQRQAKSDKDVIVMRKVPSNTVTVVYGTNKEAPEEFMLGMIMYTPYRYQIKRLKITGRFIYSPSDNILFPVLLATIATDILFILVIVIIQITVNNKVKTYELRQKLDSDIIVQSFKTFANFVDARDNYTRGHSLRVAYYAREIAKRLKLTDHEQMEMFWFGLMHDVGKIGVSDEILHKTSALTNDEYAQIKAHTTKGYEMLNDFTAMPMLKEVAKSHHEHWDGSGYCDGLKGQEIPLAARIVCVCDSFDAMNTDRCYRERLPREKIIEEFEKGSGTHFDPKIAKIMLSMIQDRSIERIETIDTLNAINYKA